MDKVWLIVNVNTYSYDETEVNTILCKTEEDVLEKFNELSLYYLSSSKQDYANRYNVSEDLSFCEYEKIAFNNGDSISIGCLLDNGDDKTLSIINKYKTNKGYDEETFIIHMYPCIFGEREFSVLAPVCDKDNKKQEVENFYKLLVENASKK